MKQTSDNLIKGRGLFWLTVLKVIAHNQFDLLLLASDKSTHLGRSTWQSKTLPSWPGSRSEEEETGFQQLLSRVCHQGCKYLPVHLTL